MDGSDQMDTFALVNIGLGARKDRRRNFPRYYNTRSGGRRVSLIARIARARTNKTCLLKHRADECFLAALSFRALGQFLRRVRNFAWPRDGTLRI